MFEWVIIQRDTPPDPCKSRSRRIPIPRTYFSNVEAGRDFVNRSARLSHDDGVYFTRSLGNPKRKV